MTRALKVLVLAHDLSDAAIQKRVFMLREGGADVTVAGFRRTPEPISVIAGVPAINLGQTYNAGFAQRIWCVLREVARLRQYRDIFVNTDVIIARNLEMLAIAVRGQRICDIPPALVYECLDIHRLLLGRGFISASLRMLEGWLTQHAFALITSSPAFISGYFQKLSKVRLPIRLVENKILQTGQDIPAGTSPIRPSGPPWIIGWFGIIRCQKSLRILMDLVRQSKGNVEVVIRGRPALNEFDDFDKSIHETPGMHFLGAYKNPEDLAAIYGSVHFTWAIDMFEEDLNSSWLLPNRLYEGGAYGSVPIADETVETGRFLKNLGIGIMAQKPFTEFLINYFNELNDENYKKRENASLLIPKSTWVYDSEDCKAFVDYLGSLGNKSPR